MAANPGEARTTIDSLAELLKARGRMELSAISKALGVEPNIIENWARILEEGGLVRVVYEVGRMYIEPVVVQKGEESAFLTTLETRRAKLEGEVATEKANLATVLGRLETMGEAAKSAEKEFQQRFPDLERELEGINKIYTALEGESTKVEEARKKAESTYDEVNKKITGIYGKIEGVDVSTAQTAREKLIKMRETLQKASEIDNQIAQLSKSKDVAVATIRKSLEDQLKSLEKDLSKAERDLDSQLKSKKSELADQMKDLKQESERVNQLYRDVVSFRREKESVKKSLSDARATFNDEYSKSSERMKSLSGSLDSQIQAVLKELNGLKANFGEVSKVFDEVESIKSQSAALTKKVADLTEQVDKLLAEVRALETFKGSSTAKSARMESANSKAAELKKKGQELSDELDDLSNKFGSNKKE